MRQKDEGAHTVKSEWDGPPDSTPGPRHGRLVLLGVGLFLAGLACQGTDSLPDPPGEVGGALEDEQAVSCGVADGDTCAKLPSGPLRNCRIEVSGGPGAWTLKPRNTCTRPGDRLEFKRMDGEALPPISFRGKTHLLFEALDGGTIDPPGQGVNKGQPAWKARVKPGVPAGCYRFTLPKSDGGVEDEEDLKDAGACPQGDDAPPTGESGDLEVVRDPPEEG